MPLRMWHRTPGCREFAMDSVKIVEGKAKPHSSSRGDQLAKSVGAICLTLQRRARFRLRFGTSLERNTPESLTRALYGFVHGDIWEPARGGTPDGVWRACAARALFRQTLTRGRVGANSKSQGPRTYFAEARVGVGLETNCVAFNTTGPIGVGPSARIGTMTRVPEIGASQTSMSFSRAMYLIA